MTIDEAIREEQTLYDIVKNTYKKLGIKDCLKIMEGHKQYIEWLEELKALREKNETLKALYVDARKEGNSLLKHERNKAIDDFAELIRNRIEIGCMFTVAEIDRWKEQLKAGVGE